MTDLSSYADSLIQENSEQLAHMQNELQMLEGTDHSSPEIQKAFTRMAQEQEVIRIKILMARAAIMMNHNPGLFQVLTDILSPKDKEKCQNSL